MISNSMAVNSVARKGRLFTAVITFIAVTCLVCQAQDLETKTSEPGKEAVLEKSEALSVGEDEASGRKDTSMNMLASILDLKKSLAQRIAQKKVLLEKSGSETEKAVLKEELAKLDESLAGANSDFERIATGIDVGLFAQKKTKKFNWEDELVSLIEPGIKELKQLTAKARHKTQLKDEVTFYKELLPIAREANENLEALLSKVEDRVLKKNLESLVPEWESVENQIQSKLDIVQMELGKIEADEQSLIDSGRASIKNFVRTRGLFLFIALVACIGLVLFLRVLHRKLIRLVPGYSEKYQPFHVKAIGLFFRVLTFFLALVVLIFVFYTFEDWVLLSLAVLFLAGLGWAAKNTLPRFWNQGRLILNIGPVREGERVVLDGVPWLVKNINMFSSLENPDLGIKLRLPIDVLMDKVSRPFNRHEPWFPCRKDDWVILSDGTRGCVTSLSQEMVELVQRGGARKIYQTGDFLSLAPLNLSANFRIKVVFGISYDLQARSTGSVLEILDQTIRDRIRDEGYEDSLLNLRVEFAQAGGSSLDFVVISDFKGEMAPLYNRLVRAIQRWCVDACTENSWEIPFPQLTVHKGG
ncbi:mechanosensitive ion channel family protein [Desulfospira joergensenii]|uniref:mechanosensitive ion channel family protein n=1 Tax=Desulfospira joergensenii TaxID=53329 RepID=UPI0003B347E5|nr:mechanosensitive ion channel family protein [Desulfospira joergensenii]